MKICIINHYALTPQEGGGTRHFDLARVLISRGHHVRIIASSFSHKDLEDKRISGWSRRVSDEVDGVPFTWVRTFSYKGNNWRRVLNMLSFAVRVVVGARHSCMDANVVIGSSPHPLAALAAYITARRARASFVYEIRDVWPATLVSVGLFRKGNLIVRALSSLERFLLHRADLVITLLPGMDSYLRNKGVIAEKILYLPNGVDCAGMGQMINVASPYDAFITEQKNAGHFLIAYCGSIKYRNVRVILDAAKELSSHGENEVRFLLLGPGRDRELVRQQIQDKKIQNVFLLSPVSKKEVVAFLSAVDATIYSLADLSVFQFGVSSNKIFDYLFAAKPVLFATEAARDIAEASGAGFISHADDSDALVESIHKLLALSPNERVQMGLNGRAYIERQHNIRILAQSLETALERLAPKKSATSEADTA